MMGYKVMVCPDSTIYHEGGATLSYKSYKKTFLNHRNSMILFLANHKLKMVLYLLLPRIILQIGSITLDFLSLKPFHGVVQIFALISIFLNIPYLIKKRRKNKLIKSSNYNLIGMYYRSIALDYFILNKKKFAQLKNLVGHEWFI